MKRLILMRHAKSSWANPGQRDNDRPLNARGRADAPRVGAWLAANDMTPQIALLSTAVRTQETWSLLGPAFASATVLVRSDLYHAAPVQILRALREAPDAACMLMLGHMPGIGEFARLMLSDPPEDEAFDQYPTAAATVLDIDICAWTATETGIGSLAAFITPKSIS